MEIVDAHFHWYPREVEEALNEIHGTSRIHAPVWSDLELQLARMDELGHGVTVVTSTGPFTGLFTNCGLDEGSRAVRRCNELVAEAQRAHPGRVWGTCVLPLQDTDLAIASLEEAVLDLGLVGVNLPAALGSGEKLDADRLEPLYARIAELGAPVIVHPNDEAFASVFSDYGGALHLGLGRIVDVSTAGLRLIVSGIMERHPSLKVLITHTGGALPYQAGRLDKNLKAVPLERPPSEYLRRMWTDTVSPHSLGMRFALDFFGPERVLYGSDYPCWDPAEALALLDGLALEEDVARNLFAGNARRLFRLDELMAQGTPAAPVHGTGPGRVPTT